MTAALTHALERLRAGARGQETPGSPEGYVALYPEHCRALLDELDKRLPLDVPGGFDVEHEQ